MKDKERKGFAEEFDRLRVLFDPPSVFIPEIEIDGHFLTVNRAGLDLVCAGSDDQAYRDSVRPQVRITVPLLSKERSPCR
jgi:hypothetical protein